MKESRLPLVRYVCAVDAVEGVRGAESIFKDWDLHQAENVLRGGRREGDVELQLEAVV